MGDSSWDLPSGEGWGAGDSAGGWGDAGSQVPDEGWGASSAGANDWGASATPAVVASRAPRKDLPPRRENDDEEAAKVVDGTTTRVLADKKKMAVVRSQMNDLDGKRNKIQSEVDLLMPALQQMREQKGAAMGQLNDARLPQVWMDRAKDLNNRRRALPGGCTTVAELQRAIKETDFSIEHTSLSVKQEKAAMERVRELKKGKAEVAAFEADQSALDDAREQQKALSSAASVKPLSQAELDTLKLSAAEKGAVMDTLMAARQEVRDARDVASASLAELKASLDASFEKVRAHQPDAPKAVARFFAAMQELDVKLKQEQAKEQVKRDALNPPAHSNYAAKPAAARVVTVNPVVTVAAPAPAPEPVAAAPAPEPEPEPEPEPAAAADDDEWTTVAADYTNPEEAAKKAKKDAKKERAKKEKAAAAAVVDGQRKQHAAQTAAPPPAAPPPGQKPQSQKQKQQKQQQQDQQQQLQKQLELEEKAASQAATEAAAVAAQAPAPGKKSKKGKGAKKADEATPAPAPAKEKKGKKGKEAGKAAPAPWSNVIYATILAAVLGGVALATLYK